jgi:signal transduction histidine kinase
MLERAGPLASGAREQLARLREDLSRLASGLHPRVLSELGLRQAIDTLADGMSIPVAVEIGFEVPPDLQLVTYFVCAEALANVAKHAAASRASIVVRRDGDRAVVEIEDDGAGGADLALGSGLRGLADRVETLGGTLGIRSDGGRGTRLTAELPLGGEAPTR